MRILAAGLLGLAITALSGCGDTYRPILFPVFTPGGDPQPFHIALVVNQGGSPGSTTEINVAGDTNFGNFEAGSTPVHATLVGGTALAVVANLDSSNLSAYIPSQSASTVSTIQLPANSRPVFVHTRESSSLGNCGGACVYVAESGTNSVGVVQVMTGNQLLWTRDIPVGTNPVALAETPDARKLYALNQGDGTVSVISTGDMSVSSTIRVGSSPVWAAMRTDGSRLYVVNQGSGTVSVIDTASDTLVGQPLPVGAGPRQAFYDDALKRLFVVNRDANTVTVFSADVDPPALLATIPVGNSPAAAVALADGSRTYVANSGSATVSVIDNRSLQVTKTISVGTNPVWIAASPDSTKVFVANYDSNTISDIRASDDTVIETVPTATPNPVFITVSQ